MKYVIVALCSLTVASSVLFVSFNFDQCCEYIGLMAPEGVSERPNMEHAKIEQAREDGAIPANVPGIRLHEAAGEVSLPDLHGKVRQIDFSAHKFTVFVWCSSVCPTSQGYKMRLNELQEQFGKDVAWWGVNSDASESTKELIDNYEHGPWLLEFPLLKDIGNVLADRWGAKVCPDVFVFNSEGRLEYRGGIDNARDPEKVTTRYLHIALTRLVAGNKPPWRYQPPNGCCPIDRVEPVAK